MTHTTSGLERARSVADAVLYEGYLLYPYRATSSKNHSRWNFGVLGPPGATDAGLGEDCSISTELLLRVHGPAAAITIRPRFLQLQRRTPQLRTESGEFVDVEELAVGDQRWLSWDEAAEREPDPVTWTVAAMRTGQLTRIEVEQGHDVETVVGPDAAEVGRLLRTRRTLHATLRAHTEVVPDAGGDIVRVSIGFGNTASPPPTSTGEAIAASLIGAHLLLSIEHGEFLSMIDPPAEAVRAAAQSRQHRCWPVLAGPPADTSLMLVSPIILYDHPEVAEQSAGSLFDSTEIDEILTLRVMTMTDEEKATARATDAKAAEIIDRCDAMSPEDMQLLHGVLRNPHAATEEPPQELPADPFAANSFTVDPLTGEPAAGDPFLAGPPDAFGNDLSGTPGFDGEVPWWDPAVDGSVDPFTDSVTISGVEVAAGSMVRLHPTRRADAHDIFFAEQVARVAAVHTDVEGERFVAVILVDDPAADLHEQAGRYLHFAPDEIEPLPTYPPAES